ncbi:MAG: hypothetical protein CHACPFDD_02433 [Phycisphaerae bacterium]|nr:hypothetical protein [Phycisphaerae bacterium]
MLPTADMWHSRPRLRERVWSSRLRLRVKVWPSRPRSCAKAWPSRPRLCAFAGGIAPGGRARHAGQRTLSAAALLVCVNLTGCAPWSLLITPVPSDRSLAETVVLRESIWTGKKIALIEVSGVLRNARGSSLIGVEGANPVSEFKERLDKAARDDAVKAVVLRINTPGGSVTASDMMHDEVRRFRGRTGKPVITCMMDLATSGGYYLACATDRIIAHPTSVTGSIGVIMIAPDLSGTMGKIGLRTNVIKSGALKDSGSPFREMNDQDRAVFQSMIDGMYARFLDVVAAGRTQLTREQIRELADGRVYTATEAKQKGLVDELGTLSDAIAAAKSACGLEGRSVLVVQYAQSVDYRPNIYARSGEAPAQFNVFNVQLPDWLSDPTPMYIWAPGL